MADEKEVVQQGVEKKSSPMIKYLIIGFVIMLIIPVVGFFVASKFILKDAEENKSTVDSRDMGIIYPLDIVVVNIANTKATRYLRAGISFEVNDELLIGEIEKRKPQIQDLMIMILSSKDLDDLIDFSGKNQIRKEILEKINSKLVSGKIKNVYFTEFVIQ